MIPTFKANLGLSIWLISIRAQKIDVSGLKMYSMVILGFLIHDKLSKIWYFENSLLLAITSIDLILEMLFLVLSNINIQFDIESFLWRTFSTVEALSITKHVELIDNHKYTKIALDKNFQTFLVHVTAWKPQSQLHTHLGSFC